MAESLHIAYARTVSSNIHFFSRENMQAKSYFAFIGMEFVTGGGAALPDTVTTTTSILPPSIPPIQSITTTIKVSKVEK